MSHSHVGVVGVSNPEHNVGKGQVSKKLALGHHLVQPGGFGRIQDRAVQCLVGLGRHGLSVTR
ncbi:MAG: Uncharacterised protein [Cellulomonadaceae bacterium TMED98]|nr:MAG: Uncharacterised protein [Cellulomonadaceae bacterium TMED98]